MALVFRETLGSSQLHEAVVKNRKSQQVIRALYIKSGRGLRMGPSTMRGGKKRRE